MSKQPIKAILFDLDGTLVDSAPDLSAAADKMRVDRGLPSYPLENYRALSGAGARGLLQVAFNLTPDAPDYEKMVKEFYLNYEACMTTRTQPFDGVITLLKEIEARHIPWGIVTNKAERFFLPMAKHFSWAKNAQALIGGDTTAHPKPHALPIIEGAKRLGVAPENCLYVGDDLRDVQAGNSANSYTAAATWGYIGANTNTSLWGADFMVDTPADVLKLLPK